ncbi:MAG TPA: M50 family metallopeptidase [Elusimicrobiota bacterium]|jgi:regulator of sigma E protease|nr:M50 family metallopeptidase [Elusimicrobiota bacterium]
MILSALAVVLTFGMVIFLHESGHFLVCKKLGIRVERFAFGFGPEIFGLTYGGTRFSLCAIPLGGFVKPAGESIEDCSGHPDEYFSRSPWQRLLVVAAGPAMNYVLAFFMFFGVILHSGVPEPSKDAVIGETVAGFPAEAAGLKAGDKVLRVDAVPVSGWEDMAATIRRYPGKALKLDYERDGVPGKVEVTPKIDETGGHGVIGVRPKINYTRAGFIGAAGGAIHQCWYWTRYTVETLVEKLAKRERPDLAGPVGIVQMVSRAAHSGLEDLVFLIGLISVAIGFFNVLPIPLLDGGHGILYLWEGVSRKKLTVKTVAVANSVGLVFLMSLLLFATYNDILRIREGRRSRRAEAMEQAKPGKPPAVPAK